MEFSALLSWYREHKRDLPWRNTRNPYHIWLSEVILQQTRVEQGLPYYHAFLRKYPTIGKLSKASEDEILKLWQGLGYYSRAENMLFTARSVVEHHGGKFPSTYEGMIGLRGIGPYTAAAVSSFAFNEPRSVIDGNVFRVLSRYFAIDEAIDTARGRKIFQSLADEILSRRHPGTHNQAMMELGAVLCKPTRPSCDLCPLMAGCQSFHSGLQLSFPVKSPKKKPQDRFFNYSFILNGDKTFLARRVGKGIWKNLYEPPMIEGEKLLDINEMREALNEQGWKNLKKRKRVQGIKSKSAPVSVRWAKPDTKYPEIKLIFHTIHKLTHQTIHANFWILRDLIPPRGATAKPLQIVKRSELGLFPVHRLFDKFMKFISENNIV